MALKDTDARTVWALLVLWSLAFWMFDRGGPGQDMSALYFAAQFYWDGFASEIYVRGSDFLTADSLAWRLAGEREGFDPELLTPFVYPPIWAVVLAPFAAVSTAQSFVDGALLVLSLSFLPMIWGSWRLAAPEVPFAYWAIASVLIIEITAPFVLAAGLVQPQILVTALIVGSFAMVREGRPWGAGGLLALAAAIKLTPAILVVLFLAGRFWRASAAFALIGGALGLTSIAFAGWPLHRLMFEQLALLQEAQLVSRVNLSVLQLLAVARDPTAVPLDAGSAWVPVPGAVDALGYGLILLGLVLACVTIRQGRIALALGLAWMGLLVGLPLSWTHYAMLPMCLLPAALSASRVWQGAAVLCVLASSLDVYRFLIAGPLTNAMVASVVVTCVAFALLIARAGKRT